MFRTELKLPSSAEKIRLSHYILTAGSCFAEIMGNFLQHHKFQVLVNPFGTIYNPISLFRLFDYALGICHLPGRFITSQEICYHFDFHSSLSDPSKEVLEVKIGQSLSEVGQALKNADWVMMTWGTAFIYEWLEDSTLVANCHKVPASQFKKRRLHLNEILQGFEKFYSAIRKVNPEIRFILTLSPVRHIRDGLIENSESKALLRVALGEITNCFPDVGYFPSYEIMMDDLRDYRFYSGDLIHTNEQAELYIWEKFLQVYIDPSEKDLIQEWSSLRNAITHRPFHPGTESHRKFLLKTIEKLQKLSTQIDVSAEIKTLENQL
jgi:hypothetical protein